MPYSENLLKGDPVIIPQTKNESNLQKIIDKVELKMLDDEHTENFATHLDQLEKLYKIKANANDRVSLETLLPVVGNLAGILAILNFERVGVVTSKALGFVTKSRA